MGFNLKDQPRRRTTLIILAVAALLWVLLFDSHSILNRVQWHREANRLQLENQRMKTVLAESKDELSRRGDAKEVERIARESYGMRREGETVYRVEIESDDD